MRVGALSLFTRCSDRSVNVASWHNPRSITWRWLFHVGRQRIELAWPRASFSRVGPHITMGAGVGSVVSAYAMRHNGGWQFGASLLGLFASFQQQSPMWRD